MYKVGDRVRVIEASHEDVSHGVIEGGIYEVTNSYSNGSVTINAPSDGYFYMTSHQIEKVEESVEEIKEMSIEELQKELGYKIKIVERESK